jgi:hypothetical protein
MNEKIKAWEGRMSEKIPGRGGSRGARTEALVAIRVNTEEKRAGKKSGRDMMRVTFHKRMDALTGWKKGDVLDMEISGENAIVFRADKGVRLGDSGHGQGRKYVRYSFPTHALDGFPAGECREIEVKPGKVAFLLPAPKTAQ